MSSCKLCHVVFSGGFVVIPHAKKTSGKRKFKQHVLKPMFQYSAGPAAFSLKAERQHTEDFIVNLPARAIPTPAPSFCFAVMLEQVP